MGSVEGTRRTCRVLEVVSPLTDTIIAACDGLADDATSLKDQLKEHIRKNNGDDSNFHPPYDYRHGARYDIFSDKPPTLPDPYCHGSPALTHCKAELPSWAWDRCNKALNEALSQMLFTLVLPGERAMAMLAAVSFVHAYPEYASRPSERPEMTLRLLAVEETLNKAVPPRPRTLITTTGTWF